MLGIPAKLAGVGRMVLCTPPGRDGKVAGPILAACSLLGIEEVFAVGGAEAIAALAYGTESVPKAAKIAGPGNVYVDAAKAEVSVDPDGAAIDMLAGPSELMAIADGSADATGLAADLLSQAEHDPLAQIVLVAPAPRWFPPSRMNLPARSRRFRAARRLPPRWRGASRCWWKRWATPPRSPSFTPPNT